MAGVEGQVALVTGGSRGIGRAIARRLATRGVHVGINYVANAAAAAETVEGIQAAGGRATPVQFDVADGDAVRQAIDGFVQEAGRLDILVNNAGLSIDGLVLRYRDHDWATMIGTNLTGVFHCTKVAARAMVRARYGRIVNLTSVVAEMGNAGQAAYAAAKAGVVGFTKAVARELAGRGITVNAVSPGLVETDMTSGLPEEHRAALATLTPIGRAATADEVAEAVAYLASPEAGAVTGHVLHVNGGLYM